jgi:hypothetical protein
MRSSALCGSELQGALWQYWDASVQTLVALVIFEKNGSAPNRMQPSSTASGIEHFRDSNVERQAQKPPKGE